MAHAWHHAKSSALRFGGKPEDYIDIHHWFDCTKEFEPTFRHRALRHHTQGIFEAERIFGYVLKNSDGREVPVRVIGEQHVKEDFSGFIPTVHDWLKGIPNEKWMNPSPAYQRKLMDSIEPTKETAHTMKVVPRQIEIKPVIPVKKPAQTEMQLTEAAPTSQKKRKVGRPRAIDRTRVKLLLDAGKSPKQIAKTLNFSEIYARKLSKILSTASCAVAQ